jgi:hypothetical protein
MDGINQRAYGVQNASGMTQRDERSAMDGRVAQGARDGALALLPGRELENL